MACRGRDLLYQILLITCGATTAAIIVLIGCEIPGLELIFLVPLCFSLAACFCFDIFSYHRGGIGLKVFYLILLARYVISPLLIVYTQHQPADLRVLVSISGYQTAIWMTIIELVVSCAAIRLFYPICVRKAAIFAEREKTKPDLSLTTGGLGIIVVLFAIVVMRGGALQRMGFFTLKEKYEMNMSTYDTYGEICVQVLKPFVMIYLLVWCKKRYEKTQNILYGLLAMVFGFFNIAIYFGYNRAMMLETAITTILTLRACFPSVRKLIMGVMLPVSLVIFLSIMLLKQFNQSIDSDQPAAGIEATEISNTVEAYVGGMWAMGTAFDAASVNAPVSVPVLIKDFVENNFLFMIPNTGISNIGRDMKVDSTIALYNQYTYPMDGAMLPLSGQMWFYGGDIAGPILSILSLSGILYILLRFDTLAKHVQRIPFRYLYTWFATLFGFVMCYCALTLLWASSKFGVLLWGIIILNDRIHLRRNKKAIDCLLP